MVDDSRRHVSPFSIAFVFIGFALFFVFVWKVYVPRRGPVSTAVAAEELPKDLGWKATPGTRRDALKALREHEDSALSKYDWADKQKGVLRIPVSQAMELTVKELSAGGRGR